MECEAASATSTHTTPQVGWNYMILKLLSQCIFIKPQRRTFQKGTRWKIILWGLGDYAVLRWIDKVPKGPHIIWKRLLVMLRVNEHVWSKVCCRWSSWCCPNRIMLQECADKQNILIKLRDICGDGVRAIRGWWRPLSADGNDVRLD